MRALILTLSIATIIAVVMPHDALNISPVKQISVQYHYNVLWWTVTNIPRKYVHLIGESLFPIAQKASRHRKVLHEYFQIRYETNELLKELQSEGLSKAYKTERRLQTLNNHMLDLQPETEEIIETYITQVIRSENIPFQVGAVVFPPVDMALDRLPSVLIISPRKRIEKIEQVLLRPYISFAEREALENHISRNKDLSALVSEIGGISTYPAIASSNDLNSAISSSSHEWLHNHLFFHPLGQNYNRSADMASINETVANIFATEVRDNVLTQLGLQAPLKNPRVRDNPCSNWEFCFNNEMHQTRLEVDRLLKLGKVEEAEAFMEKRRQIFVEHGYFIRKLNQAYFAFHETYADSPASISPLYDQILQFRQTFQSLGAFIRSIEGVSNYDEFYSMLQSLSD
jgi:hypothetical protein